MRPKFSPNTLAWTYLISSSVGMHMANRTGNFATAVLIGSLASVTLIVATNGAAHAADNCLSGPKGAAPKGSHWYYRIDHATKRNCWYVRAEGEKPATSQTSSVTEPQADAPLRPSVANARAEAGPADIGPANGASAMPAPSGAAENAQSANVPGADSQQSMVASRWLDGAGADSKNPSAPEPADSGAKAGSPTPTAAEIPLAAAELPSASGFRSVQPLLLAIIGAIALASLMAGVIFKFGAARRSERSEVRWDRRAPWDSIGAELTPPPPPAANAPAPRAEVARERHEAVIPNEIVQLLSKLSKEAAA
jgi:hypothetical protein